ncbi:hypothetical protein ACWDZX_14195 [Streptomyces collinus]
MRTEPAQLTEQGAVPFRLVPLVRLQLSTPPPPHPEAQYRVVDPTDGPCASRDYVAYPEYGEDGVTSLCLHSLKR